MYFYRHFEDGAGHNGIEKVALYRDKNKKQKEMTAHIFWNKPQKHIDKLVKI